MKWKIPPEIKIYEALGSVGDGRIEINPENQKKAKVYSSTGNKFYIVEYDKEKKAIMANDNGSYWQGYLGYPAIAYLMLSKELPFEEKFAQALREIEWKRINTKNKNDFEKTTQEVEELMEKKGIDLREFHKYLKLVEDKIKELDLSLLGKKIPPPAGF